ncbi:cytochrome p450 1d1 [Lynx pardinus]|uniref:Cytochrome p450 1d1 n=1 Tax=Lynx pardinus TaxID=191816 RepID=A0A485N1K0_LYNPA|nr:cytochrome p450 1d1 [Lynx pardinus]
MEMRKKYGDVFLIRLGLVPVLVVNGMKMVRQALPQGWTMFCRPTQHACMFFAGRKTESFIFNYGESWRKKKSPPLSLLIRGSGHQEVSELVKVFAELTSKNGSFAPRSVITCAGANVLRALCFGRRCDSSDEVYQALNQSIVPHDHFITYDNDDIQAIADALVNACHNDCATTETAVLTDAEIISTVNELFGAGR